jgi:dipeptidyl aminopeptidase/acylaminoacyl peptidase
VQPAAAAAAAPATGAQGRGQGGQGAAAGVSPLAAQVPGLVRATFKGGYTNSVWTVEVATGEGHEVWHPAADDRIGGAMSNFRWAGDNAVIFSAGRGGGGGGGGRGANPAAAQTAAASAAPAAPGAAPPAAAPPQDEWDRYYSLTLIQPDAKPIVITTTDGLIEDQTSIKVSQDGKTFYYCTNAGDIERRHIWAVPVAGGTPVQVTKGDGIETYPAPMASGKSLATLSASWNMSQSVGVWSMATNTQKIVFPTARKGFPVDAHVQPTIVMTKADDGLDIHNQLFLPGDLKPGEKRPALIFVHGGPQREMLLGYHYMQTYHWFYAVNQWLASQGYIVLSVNYRSGIGYGNSFRNCTTCGARGNAEYQDVVAGAKYLQSRDDVDVKRIGIWGLSYGGLLTSEALARNSDIFCAGVDLAGVHLEGSSLDPNDVSYKASTISEIDKWKSPVLLLQGDDDRNVNFSQMVGLVDLLRMRDVYYELIVNPDDVHESLLHSRWLYTFNRMETFLHKFMGDGHNPPTGGK